MVVANFLILSLVDAVELFVKPAVTTFGAESDSAERVPVKWGHGDILVQVLFCIRTRCLMGRKMTDMERNDGTRIDIRWLPARHL